MRKRAGDAAIDTPLPLCYRVCRLVCTSNVTVTHSYIAPASSAFTAHSGATLIKGNRRTAAPASGAAWPGRLPVSKYPGSVWRSVPALWLGWHCTLTIKVARVYIETRCFEAGGASSTTASTSRRNGDIRRHLPFLSLCAFFCANACDRHAQGWRSTT